MSCKISVIDIVFNKVVLKNFYLVVLEFLEV